MEELTARKAELDLKIQQTTNELRLLAASATPIVRARKLKVVAPGEFSTFARRK